MSVEDLYQGIILDHFKNPRHSRAVADDELIVEEYNPLCGDKIRLVFTLKDGLIESVGCDAKGCAISVASASLMTEAVIGCSVDEAMAKIKEVIEFLANEQGWQQPQGDLAALSTVHRFPMRLKCAALGWDAMGKALRL